MESETIMNRKDLFECLRESVGCDFISDLRFCDFNIIRNHLLSMNYQDFSYAQICDAIAYFGIKADDFKSKEAAWINLLTFNLSSVN